MAKAKPIATNNGKPVFAYDAKGKPICGALKRKNGEPCNNPILMANGRCRIHGGGRGTGVLAPNYKGGAASIIFKHIPEKLQKAALASLTDEQQISLETSIALLDANTVRILQQLNAGVGGDVYRKLVERTEELDALLDDRRPDWYEVRREWSMLLDVIEAGTKEALLWAQVQVNLEQRRKLAETEQKRQVTLGTMISAKEMETFVVAVLNIIKTTVTDPRMRAAAGRKIVALIDPSRAAQAETLEDANSTSRALAVASSITAELKPETAPKPVPAQEPEITELEDFGGLGEVIDPLAD